ncbi:MAG: hypothetical protein GSR84_03150 [Desulfurococcales archaeon]|nr:hypothetical protein [Desulfurococcales archaeon]
MRRSVAARLRGLAIAIILLFSYYLFLFDVAMAVKDSMVSWLQDSGMTTVEFNLREYNATSGEWEPRPYQLDLAGLLDLAMTLAIVLAPLLIIAWYMWP